MGFGQALSGLNAASQSLDVIGNNIANSATVGFKASTVTFADVYATSRIGLGTQVASIDQRFTIGTLSNTGNQFDMAIDGAKGMFRVVDPSGSVLYTRNGQFSADKEGYLVNAQGNRLTGYGPDGTTLVPIMVPSGNAPPQATNGATGVTTKVNLDAEALVTPAADFDRNVAASYNHSLPINVYDSLGNKHVMTQYFLKTGENEWAVKNFLGGTQIGADHPLEFNGKGELTAGTTLAVAATPAGGAEALAFSIDYTGSTQFAGDFAYTFNQNGFPTGNYASMAISPDGAVVASYTNGEAITVGTLALADFTNLQGLKPVNGGWVETSESGQPILGRPGSNSMARIMGQAVEESNVDMSQELVNMIIAQRTYQANAQTIKTQDQLMQTLITMR